MPHPDLPRRLNAARPLVLLAACLVLPLPAQEFDLVLRGGRLVDGTGAPARTGDIALRGDRIAAVGVIPGRGREEIDVQGQVIAPGFIDVHTHSEDITSIPVAENFLRMGVTTIVTGNCGTSRVDVAGFLESVAQARTGVTVATLLGQGSVRGQVMGGSFLRPPTAEELERMKALVDQGMKEGALGLSTGLIYLPGTFTKTEELIDLARVAARHGGLYVSHMRAETVKIFDALDELIRIAREAGIRAQVSHLKLSGPAAWGRTDEVLAKLAAARAAGLDIGQDQYVYTASSTSIATLVPQEAREGGAEAFRQRLRDPARKAAIVAEMRRTLENGKRGDYTYAVIASYPRNPALNGKNIPEASEILGRSRSLEDQIETVLEIAAEGTASGIFHGMHEGDLRRFLVQPETMFASDAGPRRLGHAVPHPRGYGNNARVLGRYVRELGLIPLEEAVRRMTQLPARAFNLRDRGELRPGAVADLVVFDPARVSDPSTFSDPHHYAVGFSEVLVNGTPVIRGGTLTAARPGRPVRRSE
jgi:N-acyl-D-amino-acid deacylase